MNANTRITLVTGANRGIGLEVCRQLVALGDTVILTARSTEKAQRAADLLKADGIHVTPLSLDLNDTESVAHAAEQVAQTFGRLDALVNNAAIDYDRDQQVLTADLDRVRHVFDTNTLGTWQVTQAFLPLLRKSRHGRIVNVSSEAGAWKSMHGGTPAYSLSKVALNALTLMMAASLKKESILVNAICPGWVATDMGGAGGRPIPAGGKSVVWGVTLPDNGPTGGFFRDGQRLEW